MPIQTVPFVPPFLLGIFFLFAPGLAVTLFANSEPPGVAVVLLTGIAALIRPQAHWTLFLVLCSLRTVPFIAAAMVAVAMRIGLAPNAWPHLTIFLAFGGIAHWRIHSLRKAGLIEL
ncbi:hypothetical protein [uncultured Sphingobium sp.]|jgi:hypothetical protein|uniref:hypothetical protein n=1 Tax=uncultured Sphingobium sp. TaxID=316087 RepID=UPI0032B245F6|tara:strand:+ start:22855 stop:23205 length:351 start_codon:yes stop_codon:yes gene_type:complete